MANKVTYPKLRVEMALHGDTQHSIAVLLGLADCTITQKFNNKQPFTPEQKKKIAKHYKKKVADLGL